jgi:hypothetical protein
MTLRWLYRSNSRLSLVRSFPWPLSLAPKTPDLDKETIPVGCRPILQARLCVRLTAVAPIPDTITTRPESRKGYSNVIYYEKRN